MRPLEFDAETMRQMGYRVIDLLVDYWQSLPDRPIGRRADLATLAPLLAEPTPTAPQPFEQALDEFVQ